MSTRRQFAFALPLGLSGGQPRAQGEDAHPGSKPPGVLYSHYDYPPFLTAPDRGLTLDLAQWLNSKLPPELGPIRAQLLPRKRLDLAMSQATWMGVVPWVSPQFFGDASMQRYVWSSPVMDDADLVLSLRQKPVQFAGPASLKGLKLGGVAGHVYQEFESMIASKAMQREDAPNTLSNLQKLLRGRVDVVFLSRSGLPWWRKQIDAFDELVFVAEQPRNHFQRRLLISPQLPATWRDPLLDAARLLPQDSDWQLALSRYGLSAFASKKHSDAGPAIQA